MSTEDGKAARMEAQAKAQAKALEPANGFSAFMQFALEVAQLPPEEREKAARDLLYGEAHASDPDPERTKVFFRAVETLAENRDLMAEEGRFLTKLAAERRTLADALTAAGEPAREEDVDDVLAERRYEAVKLALEQCSVPGAV